jgi:cysteine desulfurase / selenocysteine lyase
MNTSDPRQLGGVRLNEPEALTPQGLPDVAALTALANEFFRASPGRTAPPAAAVPSSGASVSGFETRLPQWGPPLPSIPAVPSQGQLPSEADAARVAGTAPGFHEAAPTQANSGLPPHEAAASRGPREWGAQATALPISHVPAPNRPGGQVLDWGSESRIYPSSIPLPKFDFPLALLEPAYPAFSPDPAFPDEKHVQDTMRSANAFYFLKEAGTLSSPTVTSFGKTQEPLAGPMPDLGLAQRQFDVGSVRRDFPILQERVHGRPLIWLDNAATTQKPQSVIDRISFFYEHENSNIHRAAHDLAARATDAFEDARTKVAHFLNASSSKEIVFVRGATEAINLAAQAWGRRHIAKDDEILITWIEHHANIVPWQMLAAEKGARLRVAPVDDDGQILLDEFEKLLGPRTRLVSVTQVSNALGTITPVYPMVEMAHRYGARILVDGAQAVSHMPIDVQSLDCDFYVFSGHKMFAPTGIGVLYGKPDALAEMPPWQGGGNMIVDVTFEKTVYQAPPSRFEAGTGNIADAVGLGAAIDYLDQIGMANIARYEHELLTYATEGLLTVPGLRLIGTAKEKAGVLSFVLDGFRTEEVGAALNREGIAVRSGHHCAQPTLRRFGVETTVRPSLALYNNSEDIDALVNALLRLKRTGA